MAAGMTPDKLVARDGPALKFPGVANAWTMPIKARIDMLATGIRTPVGVKVFGPDLAEIERVAQADRGALCRAFPALRSASPSASLGGYYLDIEIDRAAARALRPDVADVQKIVGTALGGGNDHEDGRRARALRRQRPLSARVRDRPGAHRSARCWRPVEGGAIGSAGPGRRYRDLTAGPADASHARTRSLSAWVYVDVRGSRPRQLRRGRATQRGRDGEAATGLLIAMERPVRVPAARAGRSCKSSCRSRSLIIFLLLYLNFRRVDETLIVMASLPFALVGGIWSHVAARLSTCRVAVAVGFIALAGVAAETGVVMLIYLDHAWEEHRRRAAANRPATARSQRCDHRRRRRARAPEDDDRHRDHGRPAPDPLGQRHRSEVMQRIAAPMVGGMVSSTMLTLLVSAIYALIKGAGLTRSRRPRPIRV